MRSVELIASVFEELDLPPAPTDSRRVLAVLRYLDDAPGAAAS